MRGAFIDNRIGEFVWRDGLLDGQTSCNGFFDIRENANACSGEQAGAETRVAWRPYSARTIS